MSYKLSATTCVLFQQASPAYTSFSVLDIRLGLEQIQDYPSYRPAAEHRWSQPEGERDEVGPEEALEAFTMVSARHQSLTAADVKMGLDAIVDTDLYKESCEERWAAWDINPWQRPTDPDPEIVVDLAAMPEGPMTA